MSKLINAHIINEKNGVTMVKALVAVPRIGDTIRVEPNVFYTVASVTWCFDEDSCPHQRVNIGIRKEDDKDNAS